MIKTKKQYKLALSSINKYFDADPKTREGQWLSILVDLVEEYEEKHFTMDDKCLLLDKD